MCLSSFFCLVSLKPLLGRFSSVRLSVEPSGDDVTGVTDKLDAVWLAVGILQHRCLHHVWVRCRTDTSSISGGLTSCWGSRGTGFCRWRTERTEGEQEVGGTEGGWRKTLFSPGGKSESKKKKSQMGTGGDLLCSGGGTKQLSISVSAHR